MIVWGLFVLLVSSVVGQRCQNNSEVKYQLTEEAQVLGYHSACNEFTGRTCCSINNLEAIRKRISKYFVNWQNTSPGCRHMLSTLMCSSCDGDIGTRRRTSICPKFCKELYQACREDFFITEGNRLRVCLPEDPVCSALKNIISEPNRACEMFGYAGDNTANSGFIKASSANCWDGLPSSSRLGKPRKKINIQPKHKATSDEWQKKTLVIVLAAIALATVGIVKFLRR